MDSIETRAPDAVSTLGDEHILQFEQIHFAVNAINAINAPNAVSATGDRDEIWANCIFLAIY